MLYTDWLRGFALPLTVLLFALVALVRATRLGGTLQLAPLFLAICLLALSGLRLRHFFRARAGRTGGRRAPD